jgi:hypothetical protein
VSGHRIARHAERRRAYCRPASSRHRGHQCHYSFGLCIGAHTHPRARTPGVCEQPAAAAFGIGATGAAVASAERRTARLAGASCSVPSRLGRLLGAPPLRKNRFEKGGSGDWSCVQRMHIAQRNLACSNRAPLRALPRQLQAARQQLPHRVLLRATSSTACAAKIPWLAPTASTA